MKIPILTLTIAAALCTGAFAQSTKADNTKNNAKDTSETLSPLDQSNDPADLKITADTRKMLMDDDSLSSNAKNVKIITIRRVVTLRGVVDTTQEQDTIAQHAKMAGAKSVTDETKVKKAE